MEFYSNVLLLNLRMETLRTRKIFVEPLINFQYEKIKFLWRVSKGNERRVKLSCPCKENEVIQNGVIKS